MTYEESYRALRTSEEIKAEVKQDIKVAIFLGRNPDRIKAIKDAANKVLMEKESKR